MSDKMYPQKNAANEDHVKQARLSEKLIRERELNDLRYLLQSPQGRRVVWRILSHCRVFESIWHPSALIHHNSGRQDVGHFLMSEVVAAEETALITMMKESKEGEFKNV